MRGWIWIVPRYRRAGRSISVSVVPFGPGTDILAILPIHWGSSARSRVTVQHRHKERTVPHTSVFSRLSKRAVRTLEGGPCSCCIAWGIRRFVLCEVGANHCELRHIGWERCGHGLTSRPRNSASEGFLNELLVLFGYAASLGGVLPLRYCSGRFACEFFSWSLPAHGHVQGLITDIVGAVVVSRDEQVDRALLLGLVGCSGMLCGGRLLGGVKRVRLHRKTPAHFSIWQEWEFSVSSKGLEEIEG